MNWILDIICIAIITLTIAFAVRNGFVKTLVSAASFLIAVIITFCFASQLSDALRSTPVADRIRESTREKIEDLVLESTGGGDGTPAPPPTTQAPTTQAQTTQAPTTQAETTQAPVTEAPTTSAPAQ